MSSTGIQLQKNIDAAGVLSGLLTLYRSLKQYFNNTVVHVLFAISGPFIYSLLLIIKNFHQRYLGEIIIDSDNYVLYRNLYDKLSKSIQDMDIDDISSSDINKIPFYLRYVAKQYIRTYNVISDSHQQLGNALESIDNSAPKSDFFTLRTEAELWESRNKAYDYLT